MTQSRQSLSQSRARRALSILRQLAKEADYQVGGWGGSEIDEFMDKIESGEIVLVERKAIALQSVKDYWLQNSPEAGQPAEGKPEGDNMNRSEHMAWCKKRALEYVEVGDLPQAYASMASDLRKHPETEDHAGIQLGVILMMSGELDTAQEMRKFIEGFN